MQRCRRMPVIHHAGGPRRSDTLGDAYPSLKRKNRLRSFIGAGPRPWPHGQVCRREIMRVGPVEMVEVDVVEHRQPDLRIAQPFHGLDSGTESSSSLAHHYRGVPGSVVLGLSLSARGMD